MRSSLLTFAMCATLAAPAAAQSANTATQPTSQTAPAKPALVKKRVCTYAEEDSYSRLGGRKICKAIEVPADKAENTAHLGASSAEPTLPRD